MDAKDINEALINGGLLALFAWVVRWAAGTFAAKQEATTTEIRGMKEALLSVAHELREIVRERRGVTSDHRD